MLENLVFSLNRVVPFFLLIVLGAAMRRFEIVPKDFFRSANRFSYRMALPCSLFLNTYSIDWSQSLDGGFLFYIALITWASFGLSWLLVEFLYRNQKELIGTIVQGCFRGNYAILGAPLLLAVLGDSVRPTVSLAVAVIIPSYGILSVLVLLMRGADLEHKKKLTAGSLLKGIVTNPLVIGSVGGVIFSYLGIRLPFILHSTTQYVGNCATGIALISIGGMFDWKLAEERFRPALFTSMMKCIIMPLVILGFSYLIGMRGSQLFFVFVVMANPASTSSYAAAMEMGGDGPLAGNVIIMTTMMSAFVLASGIYLMRFLGWV